MRVYKKLFQSQNSLLCFKLKSNSKVIMDDLEKKKSPNPTKNLTTIPRLSSP
jgi:hypothetical protein